jgi:hypothetical protein
MSMWTCAKCREEVEPAFDVCWKCGTSKEGVEDPAFGKAAGPDEAPAPKILDCLRCRARMRYAGARQFHEGTGWGVLGNLGELFVNRERFDVFLCLSCGKVEFFAVGSGDPAP